jgi:putative DNA primase/helicase
MSDDKNLHDRIHGPSKERAAREAAARGTDAVIIDLAGMTPLQYAKARKPKAKELGITVKELDKEVNRHRPKDDDAERDFLPHWNVEPWPEAVDGDALLDELRNLFRRHAVLPEETDVAIPLWVLHTWVFDCFDITPYLAITSPTPRCGKTVLMTMLYWLCCRGKKSDSMSRAALYRSVDADKPTLILDEVNWIGGLDDERANIINGGFERNGHAETCEGEGAAIKPRLWSTFCPKAFWADRPANADADGPQHRDHHAAQDACGVCRATPPWRQRRVCSIPPEIPALGRGQYRRA